MHWPRINDAITDDPLLVYVDDRLKELSRAEALELASARGLDLIEEWPPAPVRPRHAVVCMLERWPTAPCWEARAELPPSTEIRIDEALWFTHECCEGRHYLLGNAHTFRGRLSAWCPARQRSLFVSKSEMTSYSRETEYFVRGFLTGNEPEPLRDDEGELLPPNHRDERAWHAAVALFQSSGSWNSRVRLCKQCGRRLLPSNPMDHCMDP